MTLTRYAGSITSPCTPSAPLWRGSFAASGSTAYGPAGMHCVQHNIARSVKPRSAWHAEVSHHNAPASREQVYSLQQARSWCFIPDIRRSPQMSGHGEKLSRKQEQGISALLLQPTLRDAATAIGVDE